MELDDFVRSLRQQTNAAECLGRDPHEEYAYMAESLFRLRPLLAALPDTLEPLRVLDIGSTPFTLYLKSRQPHWDVWGLDRSDFFAARFARHGVQLRTCDLDTDALPFDDSFFDAIIFAEVLEHVFRPHSEVLRELHRILRPGGRLLISVPNIARLNQRAKLLFGFSPLPPADSQLNRASIHGHGHLHEYTMRELCGTLARAGFQVLRRRYIHAGVRDAFAHRRRGWPGRLGRAAYHLAQMLYPPFSTILFAQCRR